MTIEQLVQRSKQSFEDDPDALGCANETSPLVRVNAKGQLGLEPVWERSDGHPEGYLYKDHMAENPGYDAVFLRQEVANRLYKAADSLPPNLRLVLCAGHRPLAVQTKQLQALVQKHLSENEQATPEDALVFARTYVDDPEIKLPSHCCGTAVDVELFDTSQDTLVDFGCPINTESEQAHLHTSSISMQQKNNRLLLLKTMMAAGFAPTYVEWWHFSYGDTIWAYFYDQPRSLYGLVEPAL
jgi:D-alanyl-D-alanine dipeptidase